MKILSTYNAFQCNSINELKTNKTSNKQYLSTNDRSNSPSFKAGVDTATKKEVIGLISMGALFLINAATNSSKKSFDTKTNDNDIYNQILSDPDLRQKYMYMVTDGISHFMAIDSSERKNIISGTSGTNTFDETVTELNNRYTQALNDAIELKTTNQNLTLTISRLEEEKKELETEIQNLKEYLPNSKNDTDNIDLFNTTEFINAGITPETKVKLIFPTKDGEMLKSQDDLKTVVESLKVPARLGIKIIKICKKLLEICVKTNPQYENIINYNIGLREKLLYFGNDIEQLDNIINEYCKILEITADADDINLLNDMIVQEKNNDTQLNIIDTKDLSGYEIYDFRNNNPSKDFSETTVIKPRENTSNKFLFQIPGTTDDNVINDLQRMLLKFEEFMDENYGVNKWMYRQSVSVSLQPYEMKSEIKRHADNDLTTPYRYIDENNFEEIRRAINSDPRFNEMFSLHGAMRFVDRFVDFKSNVPYDEQCTYILNQLTRVLQKAFKTGVELEPYIDLTHNAYGCKITLDPSIYDEDMKNALGTYPITISICENQQIGYYKKHNKQPLISTIYPRDI